MENLALEDHLCFTIYALSRQITCVYGPALDQLDLTYPQYLVMVLLWEKDGRSVKELGQKLYLDSGTLTPLLKRLEEKKYILRKRNAEDERIVNVHLTATGKQLKKQAPAVPKSLMDKVDMPLEKIIELREQLAILLHQVEA